VTGSRPLPGSEVPALPASEYVGPANADDRLVVSVYLDMPEPTDQGQGPPSPSGPQTTNNRITAVADWAREAGLEVVDTDPMAGRIRLAGSVEALQRAFGVELQHYRRAGHDYMSYDGPLYLPDHLHPVVGAVLGLDTRPIARRS
jgi:kumamolisin